ncbi:6903_t:CDS:1 [Funneliformis geosporum]|uniref:6903_t:CDS:1 n=1 Tax=Funneliformis geosporum TaxID=1117311 RepID=A0A9W4X2I2_9GLOM|nr:6903_t:CDS:1 [Funneliformis geosporum]
MAKRPANAYFRYRRSRIVKKTKMSICSKITSKEWKIVDNPLKFQYYQDYVKELVEKEANSGGNGLTIKTFEKFGNFAFVCETPILKKKTTAADKYVLSQMKRVEVDDLDPSISFKDDQNLKDNTHPYIAETGCGEDDVHDQEEFLKFFSEMEEDLFEKYTVATDYVNEE